MNAARITNEIMEEALDGRAPKDAVKEVLFVCGIDAWATLIHAERMGNPIRDTAMYYDTFNTVYNMLRFIGWEKEFFEFRSKYRARYGL